MSFSQRSYYHDNIAIPQTIKELEARGYQVALQGHEYDHEGIRNLLKTNRNLSALMKRFKPDIIGVNEDSILFCEVKSDLGEHSNYAIEFDSYVAMVEHHRTHDIVYSFVDISQNGKGQVKSCLCCELHDIPFPRDVYVPERFDYQETIDYIHQKYPTVRAWKKEHKGGSGTAYFLIGKNSSFFKPWSQLKTIKTEQLELF